MSTVVRHIHSQLENTVQYSDYALFLGYFDHSHAIRVTNDDKFDSRRVEQVRNGFKSCCESQQAWTDGGLCNPAFFTCFGTIDELAITLVKDPSLFTQKAASAPELTNFTLAFAPRIESIAPDNDFFLEPDAFFSNGSFDETPLLVTSNLKLNGILRLAFGAYLQFATAQFVCSFVEQFVGNYVGGNLYSEDELKSIRCCMLDPMSSDDLVLMIRSSNFSIASHLISELRNLRFANVASSNGSYAKMLREEHASCRDETSEESLTPYGVLPDLLCIEDSGSWEQTTCLFASTYSTFSYSSKLGALEAAGKTSGVLGVRVTCDARPGMDAQANAVVEGLYEDVAPADFELDPTVHDCMLAGKHDHCFSFRNTSFENIETMIQASDLLKVFGGLFADPASETGAEKDSGLYDIVTDLVVPLPKSASHPQKSANYASVLKLIAEKLRKDFAKTSSPHTLPSIVVEKLELSESTVSRFQRLYSEFSIAIENPLYFDAVIDLTDAFYSLFKVATEFAPAAVDRTPANERAGFRAKMRSYIVEILEALKRGFYIRMERASTKRDEKNLRVEVKGSLNNLIACADVPLKVCLGLYRFTASPEEFQQPQYKKLFGGIVAAELNRRTTAKWLTFVRNSYSTTFLVEMDISHLFHPGLFTRIFHETGHLLYASCIGENRAKLLADFRPYSATEYELNKELLDRTTSAESKFAERNTIVWLQEIFSELFIYATIFQGAEKRYVYSYLKDFSAIRNELDIPDQLWMSRRSILDFLLRAYCVCRLGAIYEEGETDESSCQERFSDGFIDFIKEYGSVVPLDRAFFDAIDSSDVSTFPKILALCQFNRYVAAKNVLVPKLKAMLDAYDTHRNEWLPNSLPRENLRKEVKESHDCGDISGVLWALQDEFAFVAEMMRQLSPKSPEDMGEVSTTQVPTLVWSSKLLWHVSARQKFRRLAMLVKDSS